MRKRGSFAVLLMISSTLARVAVADDKDPVTETARRRFQEGVRFFDEKRYEDARAAFLQAYALKHHPAVLLNLAQSELRGNHPLEAARHFGSYLHDNAAASPNERSEAEKGLVAARAKIGRLQITVSSGGADVLVDGEAVGQSPLPDAVDVAPGTHSVEARLAGRTASNTAKVEAGKVAPVALTVDVAAQAAPPATSGLAPTDPAIPPAPAAAPPPPAEDTASPSSQREGFFGWLGHSGVGLTGLGVTAVGLGVFAGFGIAAASAADNVDNVAAKIAEHGAQSGSTRTNLCTEPVEASYEAACQTLSDNLDKRDTDRTIATIGLVAAGIGLTTTVVAYFASSGRPADAPAAKLTPAIGPRFTGLTFDTAF